MMLPYKPAAYKPQQTFSRNKMMLAESCFIVVFVIFRYLFGVNVAVKIKPQHHTLGDVKAVSLLKHDQAQFNNTIVYIVGLP